MAETGELTVSALAAEADDTIPEHAHELVIIADAADETSTEQDVSSMCVAVPEENAGSTPCSDLNQSEPAATAASLAEELTRLIKSVAAVEDLSSAAREAAATDLARYEAVRASAQQYRERFDQACAIRDQAKGVLSRAFGQAARAAAEPLLSQAERVLAAFTQLVAAWDEELDGFLTSHPDVKLLLNERAVLEQEARERESQAARLRQREALLASIDFALEARVFADARRGLTAFERDFPEDPASILSRQRRLNQLIRAGRDDVAREAMQLAANQQARGELEGAVNTLESVDVRELSLEVSQDVFGRWCDACSRLAQTTGAQLVRYAPSQGRGLILLVDPSEPDELQVFSSLGMGPNYPYGTVISALVDEPEPGTPELLARARERARFARTVLERAREFREATPPPVMTWGLQVSAQPTTPIHH
jgi:hypothetical protein